MAFLAHMCQISFGSSLRDLLGCMDMLWMLLGSSLDEDHSCIPQLFIMQLHRCPDALGSLTDED